jgi:hypothetical protein
VNYWSKRFGISKEQLKQAVQQMRGSVDAVENYLKADKK